MSLNVKVLGCNGLCGSCYENSIRSKSILKPYDAEKILASLKREIDKIPKEARSNYSPPCVHGGEPLLLKLEDLEQILSLVFEEFGRSSIQTNGLLVNSAHLDLFIKFKTHVGFSIDGDTPTLNFGRWNATHVPVSAIEKGTNAVLNNMKRCVEAKVPISAITILRQYNASRERLPDLKRFLLRLHEEFNCSSVRTNEGIVFDKENFSREELSAEGLGTAMVYLADVCFSNPLFAWSPYRDVVDLLLGYTNATCIFTECDPWKTASETTIDEEGSIGCCLKTGGSVDGLKMLSADAFSYERYSALRQVPQDNGGCKDCKFWSICKGGCPGAGINNDWRNKTRFCEGWKMLFSHISKRVSGLLPNIIVSPSLPDNIMDPAISLMNLNPTGSSWRADRRKNVKEVIESKKTKGQPSLVPGYNDRHGDVPHGDHADFAGRKVVK